ncbi:MAG: hemerythrin domain-containing protein, partial [Candidatus Competibacteraceae bacterium]|nr:hemerythrin domain-containing protein [Candidatus Competibacteraceae bacterium]
MTQAASIVKSEHARVRRILRMISELQQELQNTGQVPDVVLFKAIFDYLESYEKTHYPKEERYLFAALRLREPQSHPLLDQLQQDHQQGEQWMIRLHDLLDATQGGEQESRQAFVDELAHFVALLEEHMDREEQEVLPLALASLKPEDWQAVDEGYLHYDHLLPTVLGETANVDLHQLFTQIIHFAPEPLGGLGLKHGDAAAAAAVNQGLGADGGGLSGQYGHVRALDGLTEQDWQAINEQYLHHDDPQFGRTVKDEIRQLHTRMAYAAPAPIGLGMESTTLPDTQDRVLEIQSL